MSTETVSLNGTEYEVIAEQDDGGGDYEWGFAVLVRRPDGQLLVGTDSGCSCYGPWDGIQTESDLTAVPNWQAAVDHLKVDRPFNFSDDDIAAFAQKLMDLRPEPSPR